MAALRRQYADGMPVEIVNAKREINERGERSNVPLFARRRI